MFILIKRLWLTIIWWLHKPVFHWVRAQVSPEKMSTSLDLDGDLPVIYALRSRGFSDHAVLQGLTREHHLPRPQSLPGEIAEDGELGGSCVYIERPERWGPLRLWKGRGRQRSTRLERLTQAAEADFAFDAQIVPVSIFWGRDPGKEDSLLRLLFTDIENAGPIRKFFIVLLQGRHVFVKFGQPIRLREFVEHGVAPERLSRKLARVLRVHFRQQRSATLGPSLSSRRTVINALLGSEPVQKAVADEIASGKDPEEARQTARRYAEEIAADMTYSTIRFLDRVLGWFWNKIFDGIAVHHLERLRNIATDNEVVYMPSHRSHLDYLLMSYVLHHNGLVPPHIAAGINMNFWPMGSMLRRGGAFYLRRTFSGNELYAAVFREYVHMAVTRGYSVNFYPEGGRSRTGRLLAPRTGLLAMVVDSHLRDAQRPVVLVPVYVGYDRLMEAGSYAKELRGAKKKKESIFELLKLVKVLKQDFGKAHLSFGEPLPLGEFLDQHRPNWRNEHDATEEQRKWVAPKVSLLANEMMQRVNSAAVVNPIGLLALAILAEPAHTLGEDELTERIDNLIGLLKRLKYSDDIVLDDELTGAEVISKASAFVDLEKIEHPWGPLCAVTGGAAAQLTYYRNNLQHLVALPGLVASLFQYDDYRGQDEIETVCTELYPLLQVEFSLKWSLEELPAVLSNTIDAMVGAGLLTRTEVATGPLRRNKPPRLSRPNAVDPGFGQLLALARIVRETLERYCMLSALLIRNQQLELPMDRSSFVAEVEVLAQRLNLLSAKDSPEFADKALFRSHLVSLQERGLLVESDGKMILDARLRSVTDRAFELLGLDAQQMLIPLLKLPAEEAAALSSMASPEEDEVEGGNVSAAQPKPKRRLKRRAKKAAEVDKSQPENAKNSDDNSAVESKSDPQHEASDGADGAIKDEATTKLSQEKGAGAKNNEAGSQASGKSKSEQ